MNRKWPAYLSIIVIIAFLGFMIYDIVRKEQPEPKQDALIAPLQSPADQWAVSDILPIQAGTLKAVAVSTSGNIYVGGNSFVSCYDSLLEPVWNLITNSAVTALSASGDSVFATTSDQVLVIGKYGELIGEWGPYDEGCIITSVCAGRHSVVIADAGNRLVYLLDKGGEVRRIIGQSEPEFVIPSAYFDVALIDDKSFYVANTGMRRIEKRNADGTAESWFGEAGLAPGAFCGCCNPAHFTVIPGGFITSEKGINRIKILNAKGAFVEFVSSVNDFEPSMPLDIASDGRQTIFAANQADSKLYVFKRKI